MQPLWLAPSPWERGNGGENQYYEKDIIHHPISISALHGLF